MEESFLMRTLVKIAKKTGLRSVQITIIREHGGRKHYIHSCFAPNSLWVGFYKTCDSISTLETIFQVDSSKEDEKKLLNPQF